MPAVYEVEYSLARLLFSCSLSHSTHQQHHCSPFPCVFPCVCSFEIATRYDLEQTLVTERKLSFFTTSNCTLNTSVSYNFSIRSTFKMHSTISFFAILGAVSALPQNYLQPRGYYPHPYGTGVSSSIPASSSSLPPYPSSSSESIITPTTYIPPSSSTEPCSSSTPIPWSSSSESIIHPTTYTPPSSSAYPWSSSSSKSILTGVTRSTESTNSTILTGVTRTTESSKTTSILTGETYHATVVTTAVPYPVTTTITKFVPCSSVVTHHGNTPYYSTWLTTKYITKTYTTTGPSTYTIYPTPNCHNHQHCDCPAPGYITVTVTETKTKTLPSSSKHHTKTESILTGVEYHPTKTGSILTGVTRCTDTTSILTGVTRSTDSASILTGVTRSTDTSSILTGVTRSTDTSSILTGVTRSYPAPSNPPYTVY